MATVWGFVLYAAPQCMMTTPMRSCCNAMCSMANLRGPLTPARVLPELQSYIWALFPPIDARHLEILHAGKKISLAAMQRKSPSTCAWRNATVS